MTSVNPYMFNMNDSLDILNDAIQSHQSSLMCDKKTDKTHKRELEKVEDQIETIAPKKAGRKPLPEKPIKEGPVDPKQKRKAQNRAAQRAYRDRKDKQMAELQARISELEEMNANKDQTLVKENTELKDLIRQLQEENNKLKKPQNELLKDSQFTFQYPMKLAHQDDIYSMLNSDHIKDDGYQTISNSSSSTEDAGQSSPSSTSHKTSQSDHIDNPYISQSLNSDLLIHGEDDLFSNYPLPTDNFLFPNEDLTNLFDSDPFGNISMAHEFGFTDVVDNKKQKLLDRLKKSKEKGQCLYDFHNEMKAEIPDFNLDALCDDMKKKAQCSQINYVLTETDLENIANRIQSTDSFLNQF